MELSIINPIPGKGMDRQPEDFLYRDEVIDEKNYIELGFVAYDEQNESLNNVTVDIVTSDESQKKTMTCTGNIKKIYVNGKPKLIYYYPFHYNITLPGTHHIQFTCGQKSLEVEFESIKDERPVIKVKLKSKIKKIIKKETHGKTKA